MKKYKVNKTVNQTFFECLKFQSPLEIPPIQNNILKSYFKRRMRLTPKSHNQLLKISSRLMEIIFALIAKNLILIGLVSIMEYFCAYLVLDCTEVLGSNKALLEVWLLTIGLVSNSKWWNLVVIKDSKYTLINMV